MLPAGSLDAEFLCFQATGRQHRGCIIPQAVTHSVVLVKMGAINARNIGIINKLLLLHLVGICIIYIKLPFLN